MTIVFSAVHTAYITKGRYSIGIENIKGMIMRHFYLDSKISITAGRNSDCEMSSRFADISISHLDNLKSEHAYSWYIYGGIVAQLFDSAKVFIDTSRNSPGVDRYQLYRRIGLEREALAIMMTARVEQIGLTLTLRSGPFYPLQRFLRNLADCLASAERAQVRRLERAEERLAQGFRRALADLKLAPVIRDMLVGALDMAAPGKALHRS